MMQKHPIVLELQQASVIYPTETGQERKVWSDVSLQVRAGEWIAVTGPNGSGKSTLASVLLGLCPLSNGVLLRGEVAVRGILQSPDAQFIGDTVEDEFLYVEGMGGRTPEERLRLRDEALLAVGLTVAPNRSLHELSGGQKQLVNLAVALATQPEVLVLDEPTAMLDPAVRRDVLRAVRQTHRKGTAVIWITHRLEEVVEADRVICFSDGTVAFDGTPRVFFYGEDGELVEDGELTEVTVSTGQPGISGCKEQPGIPGYAGQPRISGCAGLPGIPGYAGQSGISGCAEQPGFHGGIGQPGIRSSTEEPGILDITEQPGYPGSTKQPEFPVGTEPPAGLGQFPSPCQRVGLEPPFVVQTAMALRQKGCRLRLLPLQPDELAEAVSALCR
jgi:energy-coupling factor transporter ATP-binding protein EcfA2